MDNHVHILINEGSDEIGRIMKRINISYAYYFNKKYDRIGHLFQDRFKSEGIESDVYLLSAVRYIHNNPVKAGRYYGVYHGNCEPCPQKRI
jgi:putative transposase